MEMKRKAKNQKFPEFFKEDNNQWIDNFFFIQGADPQLGLIDDWAGNPVETRTWEEEIRLTRLALEHVNKMKPRPKFFVVCGDLVNAMPGAMHREEQVRDFKQLVSELDNTIPLVCVCGNHDVGNQPTPDTLKSYREQFGDDYFSFWVQGVQFIVLNSQLYSDPSGATEEFEKQDSWLDKQLNSIRNKECTHCVVFQHIPWFIDRADEENEYFNINKEMRTKILQKLKSAGVKHIFCGHYHRNRVSFDGDLEHIITSAIGCQIGNDLSGMRVVRVSKEKIEHKYYALEQTFPREICLDGDVALP